MKRQLLINSIKLENLSVDQSLPKNKVYSYPLFFIHGAGGTSRYWKNYLLFFAEAGWESYAINLRGHHPSDREDALSQVTMEDYLADVEKVITDLNLQEFVLIGHSLGGLIAQKTASSFNSTKALITIASAPPLGVTLEMNNDLPYSESIMNTMWGLMNMKPVKPTFSIAEKTVLNNIAPEERKKVFAMFVAESLVVGYQVAQGFEVEPAKIKCPKLIIGCLRDIVAPEPMQKSLARFLSADYISYEQFAHLPMLESGWEQSADDIGTWLLRHAGK
jgi:pimeloyl-ACP methyl ester carboxylesterase